ncbi:hypothetical protein MBLNU457_g2807t3 [Dothideomycetes sp. NU457]
MTEAIDRSELQRIHDALTASYDPRTTNDQRQATLDYLTALKARPEAPRYGFELASDTTQQPFARHFGLSLLETSIRYHWNDHNEEQINTLRNWVLTLAQNIQNSEPSYFRNKVASLWADIAKREWAATWMDMDENLVRLWETPDTDRVMVNRVLVLYILETLSEDICVREETIAMLRQEELGQSLNEIMIPAALFQKHLETRGTAQEVRSTKDGWLVRICEFLSSLAGSYSTADDMVSACATRALEALKPTLSWISLEAVIEMSCIEHLFQTLAYGNEGVQRAAIEVLYSILSRPYNSHFKETWDKIFRAVLQTTRIEMLKRIFLSAAISPDDIDDSKYTLQKKLSELLSVLGDAVAQNPRLFEHGTQVASFYDLLIAVFSSESLLVSIPVLHSISKTFGSKHVQLISVLDSVVGILLKTCSERMLKYESLPKDIEHPIITFLNEDFETLPEQHAFLGNYRRYSIAVLQHICESRPREAIQHVLGQTNDMMAYAAKEDPSAYTRHSTSILQLEAQFSVVKCALNGYRMWSEANRSADQVIEGINRDLYQWCERLMSLPVSHAAVAKINVQLLTEVGNKLWLRSDDTINPIFEYLLAVEIQPPNASLDYEEAVRDFEATRLSEIQRLAMLFPNNVFAIYNDLETTINRMLSRPSLDDRTKWGLRTISLILTHRAADITEESRLPRMREILQPIVQAWRDPRLGNAVSSSADFCALLGLEGLPEYLTSAGFGQIQDWSSQILDESGRNLQATINAKIIDLPLRMTTSMLGVCTERLSERRTPELANARTVWGEIIPQILPNVLSLLGRATAFGNPDQWSSLSPELQLVVKRMLSDRFWQSGISNETKDDFAARISSTGNTYEGFASTFRGAPRQVRDACYHILHGMTRFETEFYGLTGLAEPLSRALLLDAPHLATHHVQRLLSLVERIVQRCPPAQRAEFLPPLLALCFSQLDTKLGAEWALVKKAQAEATENDALSEEMKAESVVRSTTHTVVSFLSSLLEQLRSTHQYYDSSHKPSLRTVVLSDPNILEPLIVFCAHSLRYPDSRSCSIVSRALHSILPHFVSSEAPAPQVREYMCTEVIKAAITSLNEPYFVDVQKDLAALIASIVATYATLTTTARDVLLSLPDMTEEKVDRAATKLLKTTSERQQRALVLDLLEGVRGVSIHEAGKIGISGVNGGRGGKSKEKSRAAAMYTADGGMEVENTGIVRGDSPSLEGVGDMFGQS